MMRDPINQGRFRRAYAWWIRELSSVITRRPTDDRPWRTMAFHTLEGLQIFANEAGKPTHLTTLKNNSGADETAATRRLLVGRVAQDPKQILLRISPSDVVRKTIRVPEAAADLMDSVVENKIETIVPWAQENTYYSYHILAQDSAANDQIDTEIIATTKQLVDGVLERARSVGLSPRAVDFASTPSSTSVVQLLGLEPDPIARTASRLNLGLGALVLCAIATSAFGAWQVWDFQSQYDDLDGKIVTAMTRVEEVKRLNEENEKFKEQRERLAKRKIDNRPVMTLIEALSRALPDTAYLEELEIHDNEARILGKAADPTGLIGILESTPEFEDVRFAAPTTREEGQTLGTFSIVGKVQAENDAEKKQ